MAPPVSKRCSSAIAPSSGWRRTSPASPTACGAWVPIPPSTEAVRTAIEPTLDANGLVNASLRLEVSVGSGHTPDLDAVTAPLLTLTASPLTLPPEPPRLRIVSVRLDEHRPLHGAKRRTS